MFGRGRLGRGDDEGDPEPDLSPMIDCVFILLIFFIVTAVFVEEEGLPLPLPEDSNSVSAIQDQKTVVFSLAEDSSLAYQGQRIGMDAVSSIVREAMSDDPETPIIIQAHPVAYHGVRSQVFDAARSGGGQKITFTKG